MLFFKAKKDAPNPWRRFCDKRPYAERTGRLSDVEWLVRTKILFVSLLYNIDNDINTLDVIAFC